MESPREWWRRLRGGWRGAELESGLEEEIRFHLDRQTEKNLRAGMEPAEARRAAVLAFGGVERVKEEVRDEARPRLLEDLWQDLRYGARMLRRAPVFTGVAVLTLGLGIGANTALFSVVHTVLLRPLPYTQPDRLVQLSNRWEGTPRGDLSPAEYLDYRDRVGALAGFGAYAVTDAALTGGDVPERVRAGAISAGVGPALGATPALGRGFTADEDAPGGERVVLLGHGLWLRRFAGDPAIVGSRVEVNGTAALVVGVMPPGFRLPADLREGATSELFLPLGIDRSVATERGSHFLEGVGRLRRGVPLERAEREVAGVAAGFSTEFADDYPPEMRFGATLRPLRETVVGPVRPALMVLLGAVLLVLLVACTNVANLLLVRADARRRELAVRTALGARSGRLLRQFLVESLLLAGLGGAAGIGLAALAMRALPLVQPPDLPLLGEVRLDRAVLGFATGLSLLTALVFGAAPSLLARRAGIGAVLREGGRTLTADRRRRRFRAGLVVGEVALAVVLLLGAGLLLRSLVALHGVDPGFRADGVLTMRLSLPSSSYPDDERVVGFYRQLLGRLAELPGVSAAGAVTSLPLATTLGDLNFQIEGRPVPEGTAKPRGDWQAVTPDYFRAVGMRLVRGRGIEARDHERAPGVIVLNEALARQHWPGGDAIGRKLLLGGGAGPGWVTVVGIVRDIRHASLGEPPRPEMYLPHAQFRFWGGGGAARSLTLALRGRGEPAALTAAARAEVRRLDPHLPVAEIRTLAEVRAESVAQPRFVTLLLGLFAGLALLLAVIGVYGTLAHLVAQRTQEIGIRMALGAHSAAITRLVLRYGMTLALLGSALGVAAALPVTRLLAHQLYGVTPTDAPTFLAVPLVFAAVALLAAYLPAHRAARVDPVVALRAE